MTVHAMVPPDDDFFDTPSENDPGSAPGAWDELVRAVPEQWFTTAPPRREWLLRDTRRPKADGVLPLAKVGQFIAAGGVGKTMVLIQLAIAVATGTDWLGTFATPSPGRVFMLLAEEDHEEGHRRVFNSSRKCARYPDPGSIVVMPLAGKHCQLLERDEHGNSRGTAFLEWLRAYVAKSEFRLIVLDPLSRFAGPDAEKDNAVGTHFVQVCESLAALTGATVLFSHHTNKTVRADGAEVTGAGGRGSSSIFDGCRWEASLGVQRVKLDDLDTQERLGELVTLAFTKSNYSRKAEPLTLRRDEAGSLVPLDEIDLETVTAAKSGTPERKRKVESREQERDERRADREHKDAEARRRREAARDEKKRHENAADDAAARDVIASAKADTPQRDLVALLKLARNCGTDRATDAIKRVKGGKC